MIIVQYINTSYNNIIKMFNKTVSEIQNKYVNNIKRTKYNI